VTLVGIGKAQAVTGGEMLGHGQRLKRVAGQGKRGPSYNL
jgi:hypothetical protein